MRLGMAMFALCLVFFVASTASASTMEVDVQPGREFVVETRVAHEHSDIQVVGKFGLNDRVLWNVSYTIEDKIICLGGRYEIEKGKAFFYDYSMWEDANMLNIGFREKTNIVDNLNLIGELKYTNQSVSNAANHSETTSTWSYTLQFQERVSRFWSGNIDLTYSYSEGESDFSGAVGADLYLRNAKLYCNYLIKGKSDENMLIAGIKFAF